MYEYGIHTSRADFWIHVVPGTEQLFIYERRRMSKEIKSGKYKHVEIPTASGVLVPLDEWFIRSVCLSRTRLFKACKGHYASDADIGHRCEDVVETWLNMHNLHGGFPPLLMATRITDRETQFTGCDLVVERPPAVLIEVKADTRADDTGNLFVQTHEQHHQVDQRNGHRQPEPYLLRVDRNEKHGDDDAY